MSKNKFVLAIAGTAEGIKLQRAQNAAEATKLAQEALINDRRKRVQELESLLTQQLDIGPETSDSLRPVGKDFNPADWVAQVHDIKMSLRAAKESLEVAEATYIEWFSETE